MALRFLDSFDHYTANITTGQAQYKWTSGQGSREPGLHGYGHSGGLSKGMLFDPPVILMEAYIRQKPTSNVAYLFSLRDTNQASQLSCQAVYDGSIEVLRWGDTGGQNVGRIIQTPPDTIRRNTWYHFGWKVVLRNDATGFVELRLNGVVLATYSGPCAQILGADTFYYSGKIGGFSINEGGTWDDLVVMDDQDDGIDDPRLPGGGGFDKFLGPVEILVRTPNGPGLSAGWTPSPDVPNWQNVDDLPQPDDDVTINTAAPEALGATDLFAMQDLPADKDVVAVQSLVLARKTEEGVAGIARVVSDGSSPPTAGAEFALPSTYTYLHTIESRPPDGALWDRARWNAIQYGYRRTR